MHESSLVLAVLREGCEAEVTPAVVQAVVVDMVNYEMVGGVCDLAVHFDAFSGFFSHGVECFPATFGKPGELAKALVVFGIDDGEPAAGEGYEAGCAILGAGGS